MVGSRRLSANAIVALVVCALSAGVLSAGCSADSGASVGSPSSASPSTGASPSAGASPSTKRLSLVALGDSVPYGSNCDGRPYPELTADAFTGPDRTVAAANDSVPGDTTSDVLHQVNHDSSVIDRLRTADAVEVEVGANDVGYSTACGTSVSCYEGRIPQVEKNLTAIVSRIHELTAGHRVLVILLDYWSVWLGGKYAAEQGDAYVEAASTLTQQVNDAVRSVAQDANATYVDLRTAFKGPSYSYDETHYLSDDGDHPNAAGHQQIAAAAVDAIQNTLHVTATRTATS
jgi:acyl-CoA thioesterase-1